MGKRSRRARQRRFHKAPCVRLVQPGELLHHKVFDERCHSSDRKRVEEAPKRQVQLELLTHARNELRRKQRMTPQLKKALGDSNGPNAQQLAPHFGDETFCFGSWRNRSLSTRASAGTRVRSSPVDRTSSAAKL